MNENIDSTFMNLDNSNGKEIDNKRLLFQIIYIQISTYLELCMDPNGRKRDNKIVRELDVVAFLEKKRKKTEMGQKVSDGSNNFNKNFYSF